MAEKFAIDFYETENGKKPAKEFIYSLDAKMTAKILKIIDMLEEFGPNVRLPYSEFLEDGIFEIRAKQGANITRILYFFIVGKRIVFTNGFKKKTQKTPPAEIKKAKAAREDYLRRNFK